MATQVQFRGGTTTEHASFNGAAREVTVDTTKQTLVVQDGSTNGGFPLLGEKNADNIKLNLGTGDDLQIYHDGSNSFIDEVGTGVLKISGSAGVYINKFAHQETCAAFLHDSAVELYYDNSKKLETNSGGVDVTGVMQCDGITLLDNEQFQCGTNVDLRIYHDSSANETYIKEGSAGTLNILSDNLRIENAAGSESYIEANNNGAVDLYWDNSKRIETTQYGAKISSNLSSGYLEVSTSLANGDGHIEIKGGDGGNAVFSMSSDGGSQDTDKFRMQVDDGGPFYLKNKYSGSWENNIMCAGNGRVELYYDGGKKFETISNGVKINDVIELYHDGSHSYLKNATGIQFINGNSIYMRTEDSSEDYLRATQNGALELYYDGTKQAETTASGLTINNHTLKVAAGAGSNATISLYGDNGNDNNDLWLMSAGGGVFTLNNYVGSDTWERNIECNADGNVELYYNGIKRFETLNTGIGITGQFDCHTDSSDALYGSNYGFHKFQQHTNNWALGVENSNNTAPYGLFIKFSDTAPDDNTKEAILFADNAASRFKVWADGDVWTSDSGTLTSDETLKENITDATSKLEDLKKLKVRNFNWKSSFHPEKSKTKQIGFIAQEVEEVFPALVKEYDISPDAGDMDHTPIMKKSIKAAWDLSLIHI